MSTSTIIAIIYIVLTIITIPVTIILALRSKERDKTVAIVMTAVVYLFILSIVYSLSIFILTNLSHFNFIKNLTSLIKRRKNVNINDNNFIGYCFCYTNNNSC